MDRLDEIFGKSDAGMELTREDLVSMLSTLEKSGMDRLFKKAYEVKTKHVGRKVFFRGLIEFSNVCEKDCLYCGIRRSNANTKRFMLEKGEILDAAKFAFENEYGSVVLQSGERSDAFFVDFVDAAVKGIKELSGGKLGITLCVGEQSEGTYRRWFESGAHRYLLRMETSNRDLYRRMHPADHSFDRRLECLRTIKRIGYQTGTGVMIGLPGQSLEDLADDIIFFREIDADMIGMGPYIVHHETPLAAEAAGYGNEAQLDLGLRMIAATRIFLRDVNIASTTALQALKHTGRELGLLAGANIIMPNLTETRYRPSYQLYDGKPCLDENSSMCKSCLKRRIEGIGETIGFGDWGDSPHCYQSKKI